MDPECWSWPIPDDPPRTEQGMYDWQDGRCATCGARGGLVIDHDHDTGLIRGLLCRSCNIVEGHSDGPLWQAYRRQNPATMLGLSELYVDPITGTSGPAREVSQERTRAAVSFVGLRVNR